MKILKYLFISFVTLSMLAGCTKNKFDDLSFLSTVKAPANIQAVFEISDDNSGDVKITPAGEGAEWYVITYGDTTTVSDTVMPNSSVFHSYAEGDYNVKIDAYGISGLKTEQTLPLSILYRAPEDLQVTVTPNSTNTHEVTVQASALYAHSYLVYFGDVTNEVGTPLASGGQITHTYAQSGFYNLKVVALSGGAATSEKTVEVTIHNPFMLPITFEDPLVNYFFGTFGSFTYAKVSNPDPSGINTSDNVGEFVKPTGAPSWSGTYSPFDEPVDFSNGKKISIMVYNSSPDLIGKELSIGLQITSANDQVTAAQPFTTSGAWEQMVFDFSNAPGVTDTSVYHILIVQFDLANPGTNQPIYLDNIEQIQ